MCWDVSRSKLLDAGAGEAYSIRVMRPRLAYTSSLREPFPQALILLGGARFVAWCPRRPSLGKCRRGLRHLGECWAYLDHGSVPGPTLKRLCATPIHSEGARQITIFSLWYHTHTHTKDILKGTVWDKYLLSAYSMPTDEGVVYLNT